MQDIRYNETTQFTIIPQTIEASNGMEYDVDTINLSFTWNDDINGYQYKAILGNKGELLNDLELEVPFWCGAISNNEENQEQAYNMANDMITDILNHIGSTFDLDVTIALSESVDMNEDFGMGVMSTGASMGVPNGGFGGVNPMPLGGNPKPMMPSPPPPPTKPMGGNIPRPQMPKPPKMPRPPKPMGCNNHSICHRQPGAMPPPMIVGVMPFTWSNWYNTYNRSLGKKKAKKRKAKRKKKKSK